MMLRNLLAESLDRISRDLALRPHYTKEEYQRWFDQNPESVGGQLPDEAFYYLP